MQHCQGSHCLPQRCRGLRARLPFLPQRAAAGSGQPCRQVCVPSVLVLHMLIMPWAPMGPSSHSLHSCVRNAMCTNATRVPCPTHVWILWCSCMLLVDHIALCALPVHCCAHVPHTGQTLHARVWVKPSCCAYPLHAPHMGCVLILAHLLQESMRSLCGLRVLGVRVVWYLCRTLADGLDLPNASRTNKTFRSGLARGARRQASAEVLQAGMAWAPGVLC